MNPNIKSWNLYPKLNHKHIIYPSWKNDRIDFFSDSSFLPFGLGRSYGDSCLNENHTLINTKFLDKFISFDSNTGILEAEAGVTFAEIINLIVPQSWFLPVTPGTKFVTLAGAIANDVHGKNHYSMGTFGCHVISFVLLRSDGNIYNCSKNENIELFKATIGGLGLTGLILSAKFQCKKINSINIDNQSIKMKNLDDFFDINKDSENNFDYTVAWIDCTSTANSLGRGIYYRGNNSNDGILSEKPIKDPIATFPIEAAFINKLSVKMFNFLYFHKQFSDKIESKVHFDPFYYPLDIVHLWNKVYGKNGFLQYQFVIPFDNGKQSLKKIMNEISNSGLSSFLTVLKTFGDIQSPGYLSFPRPGITMAIDFLMKGSQTLNLLNKLDQIVLENGGGLYPAKDARMSREMFESFYPQKSEFIKHIDSKFSSSFYRRVFED